MRDIEKRYYNDRFTRFCNINENLTEGMVMSYDMEKVENDLKSRFNNVKCVINRSTNIYRLPTNRPTEKNMGNFEIVLTSFDNLNDIVKTVENVYGWFLSAVVLNGNIAFIDWNHNGKYEKATDPYVNMDMFTFVKRFLNGSLSSISIFVEAKFTVEDFHITELYHKTKLKYLRRIEKNGLIPKTEGNFTERVYFAKDIESIDPMIGGKFEDDEPILLRLNFDEFGNEIRDKYIFYKDPRDPNAVFTYDCINPKYIQKFINNEWKNII